MKSQKIALFLIASAVFATASVSAFWRDLASSAVDKVSSGVKHMKKAYNKYSEWKDTELGQEVHGYAKKYGAKAAEKAYDLGKGYLSGYGY